MFSQKIVLLNSNPSFDFFSTKPCEWEGFNKLQILNASFPVNKTNISRDWDIPLFFPFNSDEFYVIVKLRISSVLEMVLKIISVTL